MSNAHLIQLVGYSDDYYKFLGLSLPLLGEVYLSKNLGQRTVWA